MIRFSYITSNCRPGRELSGFFLCLPGSTHRGRELQRIRPDPHQNLESIRWLPALTRWICLKQTVQSHPPRLSANFF
ncbi:unnamed protein product [Musa hybrid cultivar]